MKYIFHIKDIKVNEWSSKKKSGWRLSPLNGVQVIHLPTGIVVEVDECKSQHQNKDKALKLLDVRLREIS